MKNQIFLVDKRLEEKILTPSDINEHLTTLKYYASHSNTVVEMGVRWIVSTWALLSARPHHLTSIDIVHPSTFGANLDEVYEAAKEVGVEYKFIQSSSLDIDLEPTDLLFIDTWHTYEQLLGELNRHCDKVLKWIILHDTTLFGTIDESVYDRELATNYSISSDQNQKMGLWTAVEDFLVVHPEWKVEYRWHHCNGLTVLSRTSLPGPDDFWVNLEGENKINIGYIGERSIETKISICEKFSGAVLYHMECNFGTGGIWWCIPPVQIMSSWIKELSLGFYTKGGEFMFSKDLHVKGRGITPNVKLEIKNPFDTNFHNYNEFFIERIYDFLFDRSIRNALDIGANAGLFSRYLLEMGVEKIWAFEPNVSALVNLQHLSSKYPTLEVVPKAVSSTGETVNLYTNKDISVFSSINLNHLEFLGNIEKYSVESITLKNFIYQNGITHLDLVKIDIEGAEYDIIKNLEDEVFLIIESFLIEWHGNSGDEMRELMTKLKSKGYTLRNVSGNDDLQNLDTTFEINGTVFATKF
ncbi:FkbM family methyltransferase [bacterium]|nr:FkbM family methyltransferase [Candidatus Elulimicrobium humile]